MPVVSVITVSYNQNRFIGKCIESVLAQTFQDWEQIIVDDGSTDTTAETVERYSLKDSRIRFIQHEHIGFYRLSESYDMALAASKGKLIAVLDADDYWPPRRLEKQVPAFADENVVLAWGKVIEVNEEGSPLAVNPANSKQYLHMRKGEAIRKLLLGCYIPALSVMCRRTALELIGGFKQPHNLHCTDYPTWLALAPLGDFKFIDAVLGYWVKHESSLSSQFSKSTAWCNCSIDAFNAMPHELKKKTRLTNQKLIRLLQHQVDTNIDVDLEHDYSRLGLLYLLQHQLASKAIHATSQPVSFEIRRLDLQHGLARAAICSGRKLFRQHDWEGARRNFQVAFPYASLTDKLKALIWTACASILSKLRNRQHPGAASYKLASASKCTTGQGA